MVEDWKRVKLKRCPYNKISMCEKREISLCHMCPAYAEYHGLKLFEGKVENLVYYDHALTEEEIKNLYDHEPPVLKPMSDKTIQSIGKVVMCLIVVSAIIGYLVEFIFS